MQATTSIEAFLQEGISSAGFVDIESLTSRHFDILDAIVEGDLTALGRTSTRAVAAASGELDLILALSGHAGNRAAAHAEGIAGIVLSLLIRGPDGQDRAAALAAALRSGRAPSEAAAAHVEAVAAGDIDPFARVAGRLSPGTRVRATPLHAVLARGLLGLVHASFNEVFARPVRLPGVRAVALADGLTQLTARFEGEIDAALERAWLACREGPASAGLVSEAGAFRRFAVENAVTMARAAARGAAIYATRIADGQGGAAELLGRVLVRLHLALRTLIAATVSLDRLAIVSRGIGEDPDAAAVVGAADSLPFSATLPDGLNRQIHLLDDSAEGGFVEVDARVVGVTVETDAEDRMIGRIMLQDPSSGAGTTAVCLFVNPSRAGITEGAHFACSGVYRQSLDLNGGSPGILVDRLALAELAGEQWRIAALRLGLDAMPVWRNAHNMAWSLGPHGFGTGLDGQPGGASEAVFLDFGIRPSAGSDTGP